VEGSCERGNKLSGSIKRYKMLEWLHNRQLLKKGSATRVSEYPVLPAGLPRHVEPPQYQQVFCDSSKD
jgi:hypothetical protein